MGLKTVVLIIVALGALVTYRVHSPQPCSGTWFWERILTHHSHIVDQNESDITFIWVGVDTHEFFRVSRSAVTASASGSIRKRIEDLIGYMESETKKWGRVVGNGYDRDLAVLTSSDMGALPGPWRTWWTQNKRSFVGSPGVYENVRAARIARDTELYGRSELAQSRLYWQREYRRSQAWRWMSMGLASLCMAGALLMNVRHFTKKRANNQLQQDV